MRGALIPSPQKGSSTAGSLRAQNLSYCSMSAGNNVRESLCLPASWFWHWPPDGVVVRLRTEAPRGAIHTRYDPTRWHVLTRH